MNSNREMRDEYRNKIEKLIYNKANVISKRIKINKEFLEELLFEIVYIERDNIKYKIKVPVWSGLFLKMIDLSEVDFSDVAWSLFSAEYKEYWHTFFDSRTFESLKKTLYPSKLFPSNKEKKEPLCKFETFEPNYVHNFSGTNANIVLTDSFEAKFFHAIMLNNCDFTGLDFSKTNFVIPRVIYQIKLNESSIAYTGIKIPKNKLFAFYSNLDSIVLSSKRIFIEKYISDGCPPYEDLSFCNLRNTGINIIYDIGRMRKARYNSMDGSNSNQFDGCTFSNVLRRAYCSGRLDGCYLINDNLYYSKDNSDGQKPSRKGVLVLTKEVRDRQKEIILKELYNTVESRYRDEFASIASQITNLKG